jgi:cell volume regulation protein A
MLLIDYLLLAVAVLLILSVAASKASGWLGVPALLLFLIIGMLAGSDGPGGVYFDNPWLAQSLGIVALIFILFDGGLQTRWIDIQAVLWRGISLATIGVMMTAAIVGWLASSLLGLPILQAMLLGSIVSSTDAAAVFMVLRSRQVSLKGNLKPLLELESGSNDPMAIFLTVILTSYLAGDIPSAIDVVPAFAQQMALGAVLGYLAGKAIARMINQIKLEYEGLYTVFSIALVLLVYGLATLLGGNGFLAAYMAGITLGNSNFVHKRMLLRIHDSMAWMMQIAMFLTLGLLVYPSRLVGIIGEGLLLSFILMLLARPVSVFACLIRSGFSIREKLLISWVGLRGAVPIILATYPLLAGIPQAERIFNFVFFIVLTSALIQGSSISLFARWLDLDAPQQKDLDFAAHCPPGISLKEKLIEFRIDEGSPALGKQIVELGLPEDIFIAMIKRDDSFIIPTGGTILQSKDALYALSKSDNAEYLSNLRKWSVNNQEMMGIS